MSVVFSKMEMLNNKPEVGFNPSERNQHLLHMTATRVLNDCNLEKQMKDESFLVRFPLFCHIVTGIVQAFQCLEDTTSRELIDTVFASILCNNNITENTIRVGFDARVANIVTRKLLELTGLSDDSLFPIVLNGCSGDLEAIRHFVPDFEEEDLKLSELCNRLFQLYLIMPNIILFLVIFIDLKRKNGNVSNSDKVAFEILKRRATRIDEQVSKKRKPATAAQKSNSKRRRTN